MLNNAVEKIKYFYDVEFHDYDRPGNDVLITSGFGLGLALADLFPSIRYFLDIDQYRDAVVDWEAVAVMLSLGKPNRIFLCGTFMLDSQHTFNAIKKGVIDTPVSIYRGEDKETLMQFVVDLSLQKTE